MLAMKIELASFLPNVVHCKVLITCRSRCSAPEQWPNHGLKTCKPWGRCHISQGYSWAFLALNLHRGKQQQATGLSKVKHKCFFIYALPFPPTPLLLCLLSLGSRAAVPQKADVPRLRGAGAMGGDCAASWSPRRSRHWTHAAVLHRCTNTHFPRAPASPPGTTRGFGGRVPTEERVNFSFGR